MKKLLSRRVVLKGLSAVLAAPLAYRVQARSLNTGTSFFRHGVASGDPDQTSLVIWTRVTSTSSQPQVKWEIAMDANFSRMIQSGSKQTNADRDFTVKVLVQNLKPGQVYYYRFSENSGVSAAGRTMTLPDGHVEKLGIAVASCSNYPFGYFNAYDAIAKDAEIDLVIHLGDYIYEYAQDGWGETIGAELNRTHQPPHEIISLADYRLRHAQYKSDQGSQNMHAAHPVVVLWDDHESTNNPWMHGAQNHQSETEGAWPLRRDASLQAYYEWMPIRDPDLGTSRAQYWRHFQFGDLLSLITLETRHTGRAKQIDYLEHKTSLETREGTDKFLADVLADPSRNMLSDPMERFLFESLSESVSSKRTWRLIGNQIPMAKTHVPPLDHAFFQANPSQNPNPLAEEWKAMTQLGKLDLPIYLDTWDGYPAARERFYRTCSAAGAKDLLVLTGDSHSFWQNTLHTESGEAMGVELGSTGISSPGDFLRYGLEGAELMDKLLANHNDEVVWTETRYNGYIRLVLDHHRARTDFVAVSTVLSTEYQTQLLKSVSVVKSGDSLAYAAQ
ncbi:MAG: alkaline phosphatase D [Chitinophagales bacterium]|jgi:alkaline phosphatase D